MKSWQRTRGMIQTHPNHFRSFSSLWHVEKEAESTSKWPRIAWCLPEEPTLPRGSPWFQSMSIQLGIAESCFRGFLGLVWKEDVHALPCSQVGISWIYMNIHEYTGWTWCATMMLWWHGTVSLPRLAAFMPPFHPLKPWDDAPHPWVWNMSWPYASRFTARYAQNTRLFPLKSVQKTCSGPDQYDLKSYVGIWDWQQSEQNLLHKLLDVPSAHRELEASRLRRSARPLSATCLNRETLGLHVLHFLHFVQCLLTHAIMTRKGHSNAVMWLSTGSCRDGRDLNLFRQRFPPFRQIVIRDRTDLTEFLRFVPNGLELLGCSATDRGIADVDDAGICEATIQRLLLTGLARSLRRMRSSTCYVWITSETCETEK